LTKPKYDIGDFVYFDGTVYRIWGVLNYKSSKVIYYHIHAKGDEYYFEGIVVAEYQLSDIPDSELALLLLTVDEWNEPQNIYNISSSTNSYRGY